MEVIECMLYSKILRKMLEIIQNLTFDSYIDITVLDGYAAGTTSK
jgi:hypothetical protein